MNKSLKTALITINFLMLCLAIYWYVNKKEIEPIIIILGQIAVLAGLSCEKEISKIITKKISNSSDVNIDVVSGDNIKTSDVNNSTVHVKTRK